MKTDNFTIINLLKVLNSYADKRLPQKISYAITRNIMTAEKEYNIYTEQLKRLISAYDQYLEKDDNGNLLMDENGMPKINDVTQKKLFTEEINDLLSIEVEIDLYLINEETFDYDDSDKYSSLKPVEIMQLQSILCIKE